MLSRKATGGTHSTLVPVSSAIYTLNFALSHTQPHCTSCVPCRPRHLVRARCVLRSREPSTLGEEVRHLVLRVAAAHRLGLPTQTSTDVQTHSTPESLVRGVLPKRWRIGRSLAQCNRDISACLHALFPAPAARVRARKGGGRLAGGNKGTHLLQEAGNGYGIDTRKACTAKPALLLRESIGERVPKLHACFHRCREAFVQGLC